MYVRWTFYPGDVMSVAFGPWAFCPFTGHPMQRSAAKLTWQIGWSVVSSTNCHVTFVLILSTEKSSLVS